MHDGYRCFEKVRLKMESQEWTPDWPAERGYYWFYGWCFRRRDRPPELHFVKVRHDGTGKPIYITDGHFLFKAEGAEGLFCPADIPELPQL